MIIRKGLLTFRLLLLLLDTAPYNDRSRLWAGACTVQCAVRHLKRVMSRVLCHVQVFAEEAACLRVALSSGKNQGFQFKTHPNIDKGLYNSQNLLGLKDPEAPFPTSTQLGILR